MRHFISASSAALAVLLAGCSESGAPSAQPVTFDAAKVSQSVQTISSVTNEGAFRSIRTMGPRFGSAGQAAAMAGRVAAMAAASDGAAPSGVRIAQVMLAPQASAIVAPQLPAAVRGFTFVLDASTLQYVVDSARTGAPSTGVRFILYVADPFSQQPLPSQPIGYADLTDEGTAASAGIALRLQAVISGVTRLDYRIGAEGTSTSGTVRATGFLVNGADRLDFEVAVQGASTDGTAAATVTFAINVPSRDFRTTGTLQQVKLAGDSAGAITLTARQGSTEVGLSARVTSTNVAATFQVNGRTFATASGDPARPTLLAANGGQLSTVELEALLGIHRLAGDVLKVFDGLMQPVGGVLGIGSAR